MTRRLISAGLVTLVVTAVSAAPASAQSGGGFIGGFGGLTFGSTSDVAFGGQLGVRAARGVFVIGEVGRQRDVMPGELRDQLDEAVEFLEDEIGGLVTVDVRVPITYGMGGIRFAPAAGSAVSPFIEGGVGVAKVSLAVDVQVAGFDFSDELEDLLSADEVTTTEMMMTVGGGVNVGAGLVSIDLGYRYLRVFTDLPRINSNMVYGAVKISFGG